VIIALRPVGSVRPYPGNPLHNDPAVEAIARSIQEFGFRQPINAVGVIVGHTSHPGGEPGPAGAAEAAGT